MARFLVVLIAVLRRLLLVPSARSAGFLGLAAFSYTGEFFFRSCPPEQLEYLGSELDPIGGEYACVAPWHPLAEALASSRVLRLPRPCPSYYLLC